MTEAVAATDFIRDTVTRDNDQPHGGMLIPMAFTISRMAGGKTYPFWRGAVTEVAFR